MLTGNDARNEQMGRFITVLKEERQRHSGRKAWESFLIEIKRQN